MLLPINLPSTLEKAYQFRIQQILKLRSSCGGKHYLKVTFQAQLKFSQTQKYFTQLSLENYGMQVHVLYQAGIKGVIYLLVVENTKGTEDMRNAKNFKATN